MKITWYGTASVLIESNGSSILFDPYLKYLPKGYEPPEYLERRKNAFLNQKHIFITHGHFDHLSSIKPLYDKIPCKVYLTETPYNTLVKEKFSKEKLQKIKVGDIVEIDGFCLKVIKGKHVVFDKPLARKTVFSRRGLKYFNRLVRLYSMGFKYLENNEIVMYEISCEGKRIQIIGSANLDQDINYPTGADILILAHQGRTDIEEHNRKIIDRLAPKRVLLDHYDDAFPPYTLQIPVDDFCNQLSKKVPTQKLIEGFTVEV